MQHFGRSRVPNSTSPVLSKLAETRFVQQCQEHRLTKLRAVKASVRSTWEQRPCEPTSRPFYPHLDRNAKRAQLQGERYLAIELENYRLLERMARAMENAPDSVPVAPGVRLSANQLPRMDSYLVESHMPGTARLQPRSRTEGTKRRERERIAAANALLLHRIESARSGSPTRAELSSARREAVGYMNLMRGNFPYPVRSPRNARRPPRTCQPPPCATAQLPPSQLCVSRARPPRPPRPPCPPRPPRAPAPPFPIRVDRAGAGNQRAAERRAAAAAHPGRAALQAPAPAGRAHPASRHHVPRPLEVWRSRVPGRGRRRGRGRRARHVARGRRRARRRAAR
jgi:hypothetical protein